MYRRLDDAFPISVPCVKSQYLLPKRVIGLRAYDFPKNLETWLLCKYKINMTKTYPPMTL